MGVRGGGMLCRNMRTDSSQHVNLAFLCRGLGGLFLKMQRDFKSCVFIKFLGVLERICPAEFREEKIKGVGGGYPKSPPSFPSFFLLSFHQYPLCQALYKILLLTNGKKR